MRILSFNEVMPFSISYENGKFIKELSPETKKIGIIALAIFMTCMIAFGIYRLINFKGCRLGQEAEKLRKDWKLEDAAKKFEEALKNDPKDMLSITHYAKTLNSLGRKDEALQQIAIVVEHYKKIIESNPKNSIALREYPKALYLEFDIKREAGKYKEKHDAFLEDLNSILLIFKNAIEINPRDVTSLIHYARVSWLASLLELPNKKNNNMNGLVDGLKFFELHNQINSDRLKKIKEILKIAPEDIRALKDYAKVLISNNKYDKARQQYGKILKIDPKNVHALYLLGKLYFDKKDFENAEKQYAKCLEIQPRYIEAIKQRGINFEKLNKLEDAKKQYEKALEIHPNDVNVLLLYGNLLRVLKKPHSALEQYEKALEIHPDHSSLLDAKKKAKSELEDRED